MQKQYLYIVLHSHNNIIIIIPNPNMYRDFKTHSENCLRAVVQPLQIKAQAQ